jgi:hypothetical protein
MRASERILTLIIIAMASAILGLCIVAEPCQAGYGDAPWCFVRTGDDAYQDCQYDSFQACLAAAAGNHGFCNVNPTGPPAASQAGPRKRNF